MSAREKALPTPAVFERQLTDFINTTLLGRSATVDRDTRLFEDGYMNSLRILDLIAVVEKMLGTRIPDRAVRLANFRSIATIVRAFHPDAAVDPVAIARSSDRIFEHRNDRARITSSIDALVKRGDVTVSGAGQVALAGLALDVYNAVDRTAQQWAHALGAQERRYPSIIGLDVLERAGHVASFPQHLTLVSFRAEARSAEVEESRSSRKRDPSTGMMAIRRLPLVSLGVARNDYALAPAVCYHTYPEWEGKTLGTSPTILTACGRCYRYEGGHHVPLERLWDFTMREIIVLGTREHVEDARQSLVRHVTELVTTLSLDATVDLASDPFFTAGDEGRRLMQQAGALKYELQLTVDTDGRTVAAASFNHHHEFFGDRFNIRLANGAPAHTGCVAFGLERWVLALCAQLGVDERNWPTAARTWLRGSAAIPIDGERA